MLLSETLPAQNYEVITHSIDSVDGLENTQQFPDQVAAYQYMQSIVPSLQQKGFLAASVDRLEAEDNRYEAWIYSGHQYQWTQMRLSGIPESAFVAANINTLQWRNSVISSEKLRKLTEKLLVWCEHNGYPFASIRLDSITTTDFGKVSAVMMLDKGMLQRLDSVAISGNVDISKNYLLRYLNIHEGDIYNEAALDKISVRLKELSFLKEERDWNFLFKRDKNILELHLSEKPANQLNALIGFQPNTVESGKFLLTADALVAFRNILGYGENIDVSYQNLQYRSPRLTADVIWPYLLNTPYGLEGHFDLYKKDTAFRRTSYQLGIRYQLTSTDYLSVFVTGQSNRQITIDTAAIVSNRQLPEDADISSAGAGAELVLNRTDYRLSPRKGYIIQFSVKGFRRKVFKNDDITNINDGTGFDYATLYDSITTNQSQYVFKGSVDYFIKLGNKATLRTAYNGAAIYGSQLFRNELYQIGGFRLLRGFDEQSIFASQYHISTLELRLLLDQNSYVYLFSDNGWVETRFNNYYYEDIYSGFGVGATLQTKTGLFTISYALGRNSNNPVQFSQSRIHFGYVAYF